MTSIEVPEGFEVDITAVQREGNINVDGWTCNVMFAGVVVFHHFVPHDVWSLEDMKKDTLERFALRLRDALSGSILPPVIG